MSGLSHFDDGGKAHMGDVSAKEITARIAVAQGHITMRPDVLDLITQGRAEKGDVLGIARLAGIMAAKKCSDLIPLCHPLAITKATVEFTPRADPAGIHVRAEVRVSGQTGVEMEALTAVSVACLTIYDMLKAAEKGMEIGGIRLLEKDGGKSGEWRA